MMTNIVRSRVIHCWLGVLVACLATAGPGFAQDNKDAKLAEPITKGQRVCVCGHSFHFFIPDILVDMCKKAEIPGHVRLHGSSIGGSRIIQHWNVPDEKNLAKGALKLGQVDVLTLSPIYLPDDGIEKFARLGFENNKNIRIIVQPIWLRRDTNELTMKPMATVDFNAITIDELRKRHEPLFKSIDEHVVELNKKLGKTVLYIAPAPHAIITLREKIVAGQAPGLKSQAELFTDTLGHGRPVLMTLVAYCNYATIYRRSPVGMPVPNVLKTGKHGDQEENLNRLLQTIAWDAVVQHPLSGVKEPSK